PRHDGSCRGPAAGDRRRGHHPRAARPGAARERLPVRGARGARGVHGARRGPADRPRRLRTARRGRGGAVRHAPGDPPMKALSIHAAEDLRWQDVPEVEPGEGEVRLRIAYVGICGSDLHYYFHGANGAFVLREPMTPGHELSAVVDLDPSGEFAPGTPVTVHPARYGRSAPGIED